MSELRLHLDQDVEAHARVAALRDRGVDLTTTRGAGLTETSDEDQLVQATQEGRALLTYSAADFRRLHGKLVRAGRHHAGIIVAEQ